MLSPTAKKAIEDAQRRIVSRNNPFLNDLPEKFQGWYEHQQEAIYQVLDAYRDDVGVVVVEGPPGSGKTLIAETVRRLLNPGRSVYLCTTKSLQDQFAEDFSYGRVIKGRSNYPTKKYPERFGQDWDSLTTADCTKSKSNPVCKWCGEPKNCPYEQAKSSALRSRLAVANTSYFLTEANGVGRFSGWPFVIVDECDTLAGELSKHVSLSISSKKMTKYGISAPKKVTVEASWMDWAVETAPKLAVALRNMPVVPPTVTGIRERKWLEGTLQKVSLVSKGIEEGGWIYTGDRERVEFKPVLVSGLGEQWVWRHSPKWLLMSGTVISAELRLGELGWDKEWRYVAIPSTFPVENRRVVVRPIAEMKYKGEPVELARLLIEIGRIINSHPNDRVLVHSVSYNLTEKIANHLRGSGTREIFSYRTASERQSTLDAYRKGSQSAVIVAPSLDRGIDLWGNDCRVQVIAKIPYPNLGDKQVAARVYGTGRSGQNWFNMETVSTIVQMTGRAVRSREDWAKTYILDKQFGNLWAKARGLFPEWWRDGLIWEG